MADTWHYDYEQLVAGLRGAGIQAGDIVYMHVSLGRLGYPRGERSEANASKLLFDACMEVLGPEGTLLVPTYTYSIGRMQPFDVENTPSTIGYFTEYFRTLPGVVRSVDPMLSTAGIGAKARDLLTGDRPTSFGVGSTFERIRHAGAKICTVGVGLYWATYRHHVEELVAVPSRFVKMFYGEIIEKGIPRQVAWEYFAAILIPDCVPSGLPLERLARDQGLVSVGQVGMGQVLCIDAQIYFEFLSRELLREPWLAAMGSGLSRGQILALEEARAGVPTPVVELPPAPTPLEILTLLAPLRRDVLSPGSDAALDALTRIFPLTTHRYYSGDRAGNRLIPEKWCCRSAKVETMDGRVVFSSADNPLHVASYSQSFTGDVTREELLRHLTTSPDHPTRVPHASLLRQRTWGLCCTQAQRDALSDSHYHVTIDSVFTYGELRASEWGIAGHSAFTILLHAHLGGPGDTDTGLSGVAACLAVMRRLASGPMPSLSYRLLITDSERLGLHAFLNHFTAIDCELIGMIAVDQVAGHAQGVLQTSQTPAWPGIDDLQLIDALAATQPGTWAKGTNIPPAFRDIPSLSIMRTAPDGHTSGTADRSPIDAGILDRSVDALYHLLRALDGNQPR